MNKLGVTLLLCIGMLVLFQIPLARFAHKVFNEPLLTILKESRVSSSVKTTAATPRTTIAETSFFRGPSSGNHFCVPWEVNTDEWWTHHPTWDVAGENETHTCFSMIASETDRNLLQVIYDNQWRRNSGGETPAVVVYTREMMNSGWAADFSNVAFGLIKGMEDNQPFAVREAPSLGFWHYAANKKDGSNATCPSKNLTCYFLPMGGYNADDHNVDSSPWMPKRTWFRDADTAYRYATRQQQWLRRAVYDAVQEMDAVVVPPCTVVHVRRSDVVLHHSLSRKYFPMSAYVDLIPPYRRQKETLFLLTDDANAIDEAHEFYPDLSWRYFNRTRYRATEGGWEMQIPSNSPKKEVIVILATFALAGRCNVFIRSKSKFSNSIRQAMPKETQDYFVDKDEHPFDANNSVSHLDLQKALEEKRRQRQEQQKPNQPKPQDDRYAKVSDWDMTVTKSKKILKRSADPPEHFCVHWELNTDDWWTHHPEWRVTMENDTHTCFSFFTDDTAIHFRKIYENQFRNRNNCSKVHTRHMWSSGWGSDLVNIRNGLQNGLEEGIPFALAFKRYKPWWHFSANKKDGSNATCPKKDYECNFLPLTNCKPQKIENDPLVKESWGDSYSLFYNYSTRAQQWLRKDIYDQFSLAEADITAPCSVVHVRRSDVVLHTERSRKYFPMSTYVDHLPAHRKNATIFLLTDDANAIDEAHEFYPELKWKYLNRKRWRGTEGGWENQTPSRSPKLELAIIMATLRLAQRCDTIVHSSSQFAEVLKLVMRWGNPKLQKIEIDKRIRFEDMYSFNNSISHTALNTSLHELRQKRRTAPTSTTGLRR